MKTAVLGNQIKLPEFSLLSIVYSAAIGLVLHRTFHESS